MQIAIIGLGRMGGNIARRLMEHRHEVVAYDRNASAIQKLANAKGARSLEDVARLLMPPRTAWVMLPAGVPTDETVRQLAQLFERGDTIIDGGNTFYRDDIRRAGAMAPTGIHYVDVGTSGGIWGYERGYCMMIGGEVASVKHLDPIFARLAPGAGHIERTPGRDKVGGTAEQGYVHCGPNGAGHFVKMVHNGIEYGIMAAYAEGLGILRAANVGSQMDTIDSETTPLRASPSTTSTI